MYWYQHDPALRRREFHQGVNIVPADRVYLSHLLYEDLYRAGKVLVDDLQTEKLRDFFRKIGVVPPE